MPWLPNSAQSVEHDIRDGIAYRIWLPESPPPWPGIVTLHGAGSSKDNHAGFARLAAGYGWAALAFDQRGHGESEGDLSPRAVTDTLAMVRLLSEREGVDPRRVCIRGSSMGGCIAIHAAATGDRVAGLFTICPAAEEMLLRGLRSGSFEMHADREALEPWLQEHDLREAIELVGGKPVILMHAKGDEEVPADFSRELYERAQDPRELILVPGGDHRSAQQDAELQTQALRWLERNLD